MTIEWATPISDKIKWRSLHPEDQIAVYQHPKKVQKGQTQPLEYRFVGLDGKAIDLTDYLTVKVFAKIQGTAVAEAAAEFSADKKSGKVTATWTPAVTGLFELQFEAYKDQSTLPLYGDIAMVRVQGNVSGLATDDPPIVE